MDDKLAANFIRLIDDSAANGVPEIHFRFWRRADESAKEQYLANFRNDAAAMAWFEEGYLGDDPDYDELLTLPADTLGYQYARHIIDNGLSRTLARDYRDAHEAMDAAGKLDDMPAEVKYAVVRGFQIHDYFHILTGYLTDGRGEMALQAFTLAQRRLPYSSVWMATLTSQMTFKHPGMTEAVMDCITDGWQRGRSSKNLNYIRWEERLGERVADLRAEFALAA
jgi:ubiquinone biosynthesis protein Coq4